jgi:hypothetical protein
MGGLLKLGAALLSGFAGFREFSYKVSSGAPLALSQSSLFYLAIGVSLFCVGSMSCTMTDSQKE